MNSGKFGSSEVVSGGLFGTEKYSVLLPFESDFSVDASSLEPISDNVLSLSVLSSIDFLIFHANNRLNQDFLSLDCFSSSVPVGYMVHKGTLNTGKGHLEILGLLILAEFL